MRPDGLLALGVSDKTTLYAYNVTTKAGGDGTGHQREAVR
jgi:hypothetical protein